jgi:crotonobetainyl-CoA:carnitine CoA-transferase CaiB-like acyl-CoA transferase
MMMSCGERGTPPTQILPGIGDEIGGLMCAWGVTAALYAREKIPHKTRQLVTVAALTVLERRKS